MFSALFYVHIPTHRNVAAFGLFSRLGSFPDRISTVVARKRRKKVSANFRPPAIRGTGFGLSRPIRTCPLGDAGRLENARPRSVSPNAFLKRCVGISHCSYLSPGAGVRSQFLECGKGAKSFHVCANSNCRNGDALQVTPSIAAWGDFVQIR